MGFLLTEFEDFLSHVKIRKIPCWCKLLAGWSLKGNRHVFGKTKKILNFAFIKPNVPEKMTIWTLVNINLQDTMSAFNEEYFLVCETFEVSRVYSSRAVNVIWLFAFTPVNTAERFAATLDEDPGSLRDFLTDRSDKQIRSPACFFPPLQMMILNSLGWVVKCRQLSKSKIWIHLDIRDSSADNLLKEIRCLSNSCTKTKCWNPAWPEASVQHERGCF